MNWIKVESNLCDKPEVMQMADILGIDEDAVVGHLVRFWCWADANLSAKCPVFSGTKNGIDRRGNRTGFCDALISVGWLIERDGQFEIPHFEYHLSKSAKTRAIDSRRKQSSRREPDKNRTNNGQMSGCETENTVTREEKRREEKNINTEEDNTHGGEVWSVVNPTDFMAEWNRCLGLTPIKSMSQKRKTALKARSRETVFAEKWRECIVAIANSDFCCGGGDRGWRADVDWFLRPDTYLKILEGKFANERTGTGATNGKRTDSHLADDGGATDRLLARLFPDP